MILHDLTIRQEAQAWVVRLDSGLATEEDACAFKSWCARSRAHATAFCDAREIWSAMRPAALNVRKKDRQRLPAEAQPGGIRTGRRAFLGGAVAASVTYLALRPPMQLWPSLDTIVAGFAADYQTGTGEQRQIAMSDGVVVQMNTQTRMNLRAASGRDAGLELLAGEVEIQATLDGSARLTVLARDGAVSATHARFNIRHTEKDICVTCLAGQVQIDQAKRRITLVPGEQLRYREGNPGLPQRVNTMAVTAWRKRMLVFNHVALSDVVAEVNRYRPGKLILRSESLGRNKVQASFSLDRLDDVITLICDAYGAEATRLPGDIVLLHKATA